MGSPDALHAHRDLLWPQPTAIPEAWAAQPLDLWTAEGGVIQKANGPCGVLAVLQTELWKRPAKEPKQRKLHASLCAILCRINAAAGAELAARVATAQDLVEACARAYGPERLRRELPALSGCPLVDGPWWLCTPELVMLLLCGELRSMEAFFAWPSGSRDGAPKRAFYSAAVPENDVGFVTAEERANSVPVCDDLKHQRSFVLHGGDHFTAARVLEDAGARVVLEHYNGLAPAGPRHTRLVVEAAARAYAPAVLALPRETRPRAGAAAEIVQAFKAEPGDLRTWEFELLPAIDDGSATPVDDAAPLLVPLPPRPPERPWTCAACYHNRYATMCFGRNEPLGERDPTTVACEHCGRVPTAEAGGWTVRRKYAELCPRMRAAARERYAPKAARLLELVFGRDCTVHWDGPEPGM